MKVTIEMENIQSIIEAAAEENTKAVIEDYVKQATTAIIERDFQDIIKEEVTSKMNEFISTYIENYQLSVGGGFDGTPIQYFTPREYINKIISDTFRDRKLTTYTENSYGSKSKKEVSFEDFIKDTLNPTYEIQRHMKELAEKVKREVSYLLKNEYDKSLQSALSGVIIDVIMQNDAFKDINNNIKRLGE